ncbi:MAG: hypothetical protein H6662_00730 [Ardenticatenaceae bacterium]|nr:hypothetical protein [Anaerolineales bacterium]MCB8920082.1 hypothetical protein [Ardenticatenaceae bacterium]
MKERTINTSGLLLIGLGALALLHTTILPALGWDFGLWRLWPLLVGAAGLGLVAAPFAFPDNRGLKALFIPGMPVLMVGALLLWGSLFTAWGVWATFWPMIVLSLAFGFFLTAVFMRNIWLMIPAIIIGMNGLVFQFCALTNWWEAWSVLWTIEPLSVGLALLVASSGHRRGLLTAGTILVAIAGIGFTLMSLVLSGWVSILGSAILILVGLALLLRGRGGHFAPKEKLYQA